MQKLWIWLEQEATDIEEILGLIWIFFCIDIAVSLIGIFVVEIIIGVKLPECGVYLLKYPFYLFVLMLMGAVAIEEFIFRFIPLSIAYLLARKIWNFPFLFIVFAVVSSFFFGWAHGTIYNVLIQGVSGILICLLFLKCGGYQGRIFKALLVTSCYHFFFNFVLFLLYMTRNIIGSLI